MAVEDDLITEDNLGIMMCTYHEYYEYPLSHAENVNYQNTMEAWAAIAKKMCVWHYGVNFDDELIVYNNFNTMKPDYEYIASLGVNAFFEQASNRTNTATFSELKIYLQSKLIWEPNVDINALTNAFMENYYKDAGMLMGEYLDELRAQYAYMATELGKLNSIRGTVASKEYFSHGMLKNWLSSEETVGKI